MAVYVVTGKLGAGKTLSCVDKIRTALFEGRRVATNLDLNLDQLNSRECKTPVLRLPDKPRVEDLEAIGYGYPPDEPYDEKRFGDLVLDELGTWMNTRAYRDAERFPVINWFLHARKYRWNVYLLVQHEEVIDKQLRDSLCEHLVCCSRTDRMRFLKMKLPAGHIAHVYYGSSSQGMKVDTWYYRGRDLYAAYDTGQVFSDQLEFMNGRAVDMRAMYSMLPSSTLHDWYAEPEPPRRSIKKILWRCFAVSLFTVISPFCADTRSMLKRSLR